MVIQTVKYEILQPEPKTIEVPLDSNFGVAIGIKYQGKDIHIKQNDVLLDGQEAIDVADNKYAVFKLSSDGNEGIESYQVDTGPVGIDYVDASAYAEKPILPSPANTTIACDLSPLAGKAFVKSVITTDEEMLKAPFNLQVFNTEGEMQSTTGSPISIIYAGDANNPSASDLPIWRIQYKKNWGYRITWQKPNADYTDWINTEEPLVVPEKAYV